jgi:hypothetical protein
MFMFALWNYPFLRFSFIACFAYRIIQDAQGWERSVAKTFLSQPYNPRQTTIRPAASLKIQKERGSMHQQPFSSSERHEYQVPVD